MGTEMASSPSYAECAELAKTLSLMGQPLEPPNFHEMGWIPHQIFSAEDDPDRTKMPWDAPSFVREKDPALQSVKTFAQDLDLVSALGTHAARLDSFATVVHGVLDEEDCAELLKHVNEKGFTPALINLGHGRQALLPEARDGHRVIVDSLEFSSWLFEVLRPHLPPERKGKGLVDLNERCRFLCYTPGQYFEAHHDGYYERPVGHPNAGDGSEITVQLYLHDVPPENGGATTFLSHDGGKSLACQPLAGSVLMFSQDLLHEGSILTAGLKYTLRTEAMYRDPPQVEEIPMGGNLRLPIRGR